MAIITYPLNDITYDAADAETYLSTRKSGVYSSEEHFGVTISGTYQLTIAPGLAWMNNDNFKGKSVAVTDSETIVFDIADTLLPRIDLVVLRFDANENRSYFTVKKGAAASAPNYPEITRNAAVYELALYAVRFPAASAGITQSDITSLLLDEQYCGVMRDGVTGVPTSQIQEQAMAIMASLKESLSAELGTIVGATVTTDANGGKPSCDIVFSGGNTKTIIFAFHNLKGAPGVSVTHTWDGSKLTFTSASGTTTIDLGAGMATRKELVRFTTSGTFKPANYPSSTGLYDIMLLGGGGSGSYGTSTYPGCGGSAGGFAFVSGVPLKSGTSYTVTIGAGGASQTANTKSGNAGGSTSLGGFTASGGNGGLYEKNTSATSVITEGVTVGAYTSEAGTGRIEGDFMSGMTIYSNGGSSFFGVGGSMVTSSGGAGQSGSGYGAGGSGAIGGASGKGANGLVIVYGY